ncbi:hypothetical protein RMCBS344292_18391 [Rhizopus microsporus]|nr:hypothetical protein RMCBS344292_18391 [Rhizopus microsporus]
MINETTDQVVPQIDSNNDVVVPQSTMSTSPLAPLPWTLLEEGMYREEYMYAAAVNERHDTETAHGDQEIEYPA